VTGGVFVSPELDAAGREHDLFRTPDAGWHHA
jgi:hypothetical protein